MSGYVEAGYLIVIATLGGYSISVITRERAAKRRASPAAPVTPPPAPAPAAADDER